MAATEASAARARSRPARRPRRRPPRVKTVVVYGSLSVYGLVTIAAFLWVVLQSLKDNAEFISSLPWTLPSTLHFENYAQAWQIGEIGNYFFNSVGIAVGSSLGSLVIAIAASYALARIRTARWRALLLRQFLFGMMVPSILSVVPLFFIWQAIGLGDSRLGLALIYGGLMLPFSIFYLSGYFQDLPYELEEAASVDGARPLQVLIRVFLPLAAPGCAAIFVVNFLFAWNEFFYALIFLNSTDNYTIPLGIFNLEYNADYSAQWVFLFAGMMISVTPVLLLYGALSNWITRAVSAGALKG